MNVIKEEKGVQGYQFNIYINKKIIRSIFVQRIKRVKDNKTYLFLVNSEGKVIDDVFSYLNYTCNIKSLNAREQAQSALKLLYTYLEIVNKPLSELKRHDILNFSDFLLGLTVTGNTFTIECCNSRTISTHNYYFDAIRRYMEISNVKNELFFQNVNVNKNIYNRSIEIKKYKSNYSRDSSFNNFAPKYISINEYKRIIEYFENNLSEYKKRDKLIIDLMYLLGLRIGEVLGITLEDIKIHDSDSRAGKIVLRNRVSEKEYQKAKTCFTPTSINDYNSKVYQLRGKGFQEVYLPYSLMESLNEYIDESRNLFEFSEQKINNIMHKSLADSVESSKENYYIFLNKNGGCLSNSGWNKRLKEIYKECGIAIDVGSKNINLSHRLRHGYAMFLTMNMKKDSLYVMKKLRQRSLSSTDKYFNPTEEEVLIENMKIEGEMLKYLRKSSEVEND